MWEPQNRKNRLQLAALLLIFGACRANSVQAEPEDVSSSPYKVVLEPVQRPGPPPRPEPAVSGSQYDVLLATWDLGGSEDRSHPANRPGFHPAVRVVVNTTSLSGRGSYGALTPGAVLAQTRNTGYWPFRLCFEDELRRSPEARGTTLLRFSVARTGRVTYARRLRSELSKQGSDCLRKATYKLRFTSLPRRRVDVQMRIELSPGDVPVAALSASAPELLTEAQSAFEKVLPAARQCYAEALKRDKQLWGRAVFRLNLDAAGRVQRAHPHPPPRADETLLRCVGAALEQLSAAGSTGEVQVALRFGENPGAGQ